MKTGRYMLVVFSALVLTGALTVGSMAGEKTVELGDVPAAVQATINQNLNGGTLVEIEIEDGSDLYEVDTTQNGKTVEFKVAKDGTLLPAEPEEADEEDEDDGEEEAKEEAVASVADLPAAVQATVAKVVGANPVQKITKESDDDEVAFEVEYQVDGVEQSVDLSEAGDILELESAVETGALPAAVAKALQEEFPGATVDSAVSVQTFTYEVLIVKNGKKKEVKVNAAGDVEDEDGDEGHDGCKKDDDGDEDHESHSHDKGARKDSKDEDGD